MNKTWYIALSMLTVVLMYYSHAEQEDFTLPKKQSVPSVSYEQLCELLAEVMHTCGRLQRSLANACDCAVDTTRAILTRNKKNQLVAASKQERTERAQRIKRCVIRIQALEKELKQLCSELVS